MLTGASADFQAELQQALALHQQGDLEAAAQIYDRINAVTVDVNSLHLRGLIEHHRGRSLQAIPLIERAVALKADSAIMQHNLGAAYLATGQLARAEQGFRQACRLNARQTNSWLQLAGVLINQQRPGEAALILLQLLESEAPTAEIWQKLGIAWQKSGQTTRAEAAFYQALQLTPDCPFLHNDLGSALLEQDKLREATVLFQRATALKPDFAAAWSNLGASLQSLQEVTASEQALREAIRLDPLFAGAYYNLANLLRDSSRVEEAVRLYQQALTLQSDNANLNVDILQNLSLAYNNGGQFEEAAAVSRKILQLQPDNARAYYSLFTFNPDQVTDEESQVLEKLLTKNQLSDTEKAEVWFSLGKRHDQRGEYARAFACFEQGNLLVERRHRFCHETLKQQVDQLQTVFSAEFFRKFSARGTDSRQPVFVLGMPRSGSTLVDQILTSHSQIRGAGEFAGLPQLIQEYLTPAAYAQSADGNSAGGNSHKTYPETVQQLGEATLREIAEQYLSRLQATTGPAELLTDKLPGNVFHIGLIALLFPRATLIYTQRNPLDTCLSCYFQNFSRQYEFSFDLRNTARYYREQERLLQHWQNVCPISIYRVDYEELVTNQKRESRRLIEDICGLPWEEACLAHHKNSRAVQTASLWQVRQPVYQQSLHKWKHYREHLRPLFEELNDHVQV